MDGESQLAQGLNLPLSLFESAIADSSATIANSKTLPPAAYTSTEFYTAEMEKVFRRDWICVGHVSQVEKVGDYFTVDMFGELLIVVRGPDRVRVMSRICLHRWAPLAEGSGNAKILSCPFHKWGYALDGQLLGAPFMEQAADFVPKDCRLPEIRSEIVESLGLIFITFSDRTDSMTERLKCLSERLAPAAFGDRVVADTRIQENDYNWKILIETFMECYHHIGAHRTTLEPDYPARLSYVEDAQSGYSVCHSPLREELAHEAYIDEDRRPFSLYLIYPNLLMGTTMDPAQANRVNFITVYPVAPNKVVSKRHMLAKREDAGTPALAELMEKNKERFAKINAEDNAVNDMQQVGALSRFAQAGRLSHLEGSVWHLAEYIRTQLAS